MTRFWRYLPLVLVLLGAGMFRTWADYNLTPGVGLNFVAFDGTHGGGTVRCAGTNQCAAVVNIDTTGAQTGVSGNPFSVTFPSAQAVTQSGTWNVGVTGTPAVTQSGTWTVQPGNTANTTPWLVNVNNANANGQATMPNSAPVAVASDQKGACTSHITFNQTASTDILTLTNKVWICSIVLVSSSAQQVSVVAGTGTVCATSTDALVGATTADATHGVPLIAGAGFVSTASFPWINSNNSAVHLCILQSSTGLVSGTITYMDHT